MASPSKPAAQEHLSAYRARRDFSRTAEPQGEQAPSAAALSFVIQKHAATRLHYDFRLELDGVLLSWAVPKGPSYDPADKRMAIHVEDHPLSYGSFEGRIPPQQYGAGSVMVWDNGTWEPIGDPHAGLAQGKLVFRLRGQKLMGLWELVKIAKPGEKQEPWILFKKRDEYARSKADYDVLSALPDSVLTTPPKQAADKASGTLKGAGIPGAVKAPLPAKLSPQLATLADGVPPAGRWSCEIKFDGYRIMARLDKGKATLFTRGGHDWSSKLPALVRELESLNVGSAWLDGEIVVLGADGAPDFNALQKYCDRVASDAAVDYFLFDLPYFEGQDLRNAELVRRKALLKALLDQRARAHLRYSEGFEADPRSLLMSACRMNLEGIIAKRSDSRYESRRTQTWLKLKCKLRQEFVVCGYTDRSDGSPEIGSLLLGVYGDSGDLVAVGGVGTGWDREAAMALKTKLAKLEITKSPFAAAAKRGPWSRRAAASERWVQPKAVAEVEFSGWTPDSQIRHASFLALRTDKPARSVRREDASTAVGSLALRTAGESTMGGIRISHAERIIDASTGLTKLDLARYYESIAEWILPHLRGRPCSLVRAPEGVLGPQFFQKHGDRIGIPGITELPVTLWPEHEALLEVATAQALIGCAQMNVIELHTWNSTKKSIDKPDRMIFDLDPGEGAPWSQVQEAALLVRTLLTELRLEAWLKTSGGKGLHVVVPLAPRLGYEGVKAFAQAIVRHLAKTLPARFVAVSGPANRIGKVFVDYLRNGSGATTAAAFSARARPGLGVSMPVSWDDLPTIKSSAQWNIANAREHLSFQTSDPWADYWKKRQTLTASMKALGFKLPARE